jgi:hypothetical protein
MARARRARVLQVGANGAVRATRVEVEAWRLDAKGVPFDQLAGGARVSWRSVRRAQLPVSVRQTGKTLRRVGQAGAPVGTTRMEQGGEHRYTDAVDGITVCFRRVICAHERTEVELYARPGSNSNKTATTAGRIMQAIERDLRAEVGISM